MIKEIDMYRTHQEGAGVDAKLTAEEELEKINLTTWIDWDGKRECPLPAGTKIEALTGNGHSLFGSADDFHWKKGWNIHPVQRFRLVEMRNPAELCEKYLETAPTQGTEEPPPSKYHVKNIWKDKEWVDFYMMYDQCRIGKTHQVGDSAIEHAWKKITQAGERSGGKSKVQDIKEAIQSLEKALEMISNERS